MERVTAESGRPLKTGLFAPLRYAPFRNVWAASVLANLGLFVQTVGMGWAMMKLTAAADQVALVQTASMLPLMILAVPSGALADIVERRTVCILGLLICLSGATALTLLSFLGPLTPTVLLLFGSVVGCGVALFAPAWQASVVEQVPLEALPAAVGLNAVSYNIARGVGPAIGGVVVAALGVSAAFAVNALFYIPLLVSLLLWKGATRGRMYPQERFLGAIRSGGRFIANSPPVFLLLLRVILTALICAPMMALIPIIARELLNGDADVYGLLLGAFGLGAIFGGLNIASSRARLGAARVVTMSLLILGAAAIAIGTSGSALVTGLALGLAGAAWMLLMGQLNVNVQMSVPRWVAGRVMSVFSASAAGGIAIGSWGWGHVAERHGVTFAFGLAGVMLLLLAAGQRWLPLTESADAHSGEAPLAPIEASVPMTGRSGPIIVEIEYQVAPEHEEGFRRAIREVQLRRRRNGAYSCALGRDVADPTLWIERFQYVNWDDYVRHRTRHTSSEGKLMERVLAFHNGAAPVRVRRILDWPGQP